MKDVTEFYHIACAITKGWPATYPAVGAPEASANRPNSFAVLRSLLDLEAANLAKAVEHARPPFLFIRGYDGNSYRSGIKIEYPLIGCAEDALTFFHPTGEGVQKQRQRTNLFIIDQLPFKETGYTDTYSAGRAVEEVGRDLRQIAMKFMATLSRWAYLEFSAGPYTDGWHDEKWLKEHGDPAAQWETTEQLTDCIIGVNQLDGDIIYQGSDNNAILITNLIIETDYCPPAIEFNYNYTASPFEAVSEKYRDDV